MDIGKPIVYYLGAVDPVSRFETPRISTEAISEASFHRLSQVAFNRPGWLIREQPLIWLARTQPFRPEMSDRSPGAFDLDQRVVPLAC